MTRIRELQNSTKWQHMRTALPPRNMGKEIT